MRVTSVVASFLACLLIGCASASSVGSIDLTTDPEPIRGRSLLVVPMGQDFGTSVGFVESRLLGAVGMDTVRVREWVPLDSLDAPSYQAFALDALVDVVRQRGDWTSVRVEPMTDSVAFVEQTYSVRQYSPTRSRAITLRKPITAPPAGVPDTFGPDADYVLIVSSAGVAFREGGNTSTPGFPSKEDDRIVVGGNVLLWDNRQGMVVRYGSIGGSAPIESRMVSSAEERTPSALLRVALENMSESIERDFPVMVAPE